MPRAVQPFHLPRDTATAPWHLTDVRPGVIDAVRLFVHVAEGYAVVGAAFALWFLWRRVDRVDPRARGAGAGFRALIAPGVVLVWPLLFWRLVTGSTGPPEEWNAHRAGAERAAPSKSTP